MARAFEENTVTTPPSYPTEAANTGAMEMLLDLELPVLVKFGGTKMLLRDLLNLKPGSVIDFNRPPTDPVEVLVNGRVVARGVAVVVQGNYGVRISEIIATREGLAAPPAQPSKPPSEAEKD